MRFMPDINLDNCFHSDFISLTSWPGPLISRVMTIFYEPARFHCIRQGY